MLLAGSWALVHLFVFSLNYGRFGWLGKIHIFKDSKILQWDSKVTSEANPEPHSLVLIYIYIKLHLM